MNLITLDPRDRKQLYEQIIDNVKKLILSGDMTPDDKLPSVRSLAKELGINPNTIQKAYTELERLGVIITLPGRGSIIIADRNSMRGEQEEKLIDKMAYMAQEVRTSGMNKREFMNAAEAAWIKSGGLSND